MQRGSSATEILRARPSRRRLEGRNAIGLWLGLLTTLPVVSLGGAYLSLAPMTTVLMGMALEFVWLDGITTDTGLRRGLEEANPIISSLQGIAGRDMGLLLSRILLSGLVVCMAFAFRDIYALLVIAIVFTICASNNMARVVRLKASWR